MGRATSAVRLIQAGLACSAALFVLARFREDVGAFHVLLWWILLPAAVLRKFARRDLTRFGLVSFGVFWMSGPVFLFVGTDDPEVLILLLAGAVSVLYVFATMRLYRIQYGSVPDTRDP